MAAFKEVVEKREDDERRKLMPLTKYTKGDAKDMVKNCIQLLMPLIKYTKGDAKDMVKNCIQTHIG